MTARTLYDRLWDEHVVATEADGTSLLYIDRQLLHEVSSPQAFEGLRTRGLRPRRPQTQLAVADHAVPTRRQTTGPGGIPVIADPQARAQVALLQANATATDVRYIALDDARHGIVHIIGPELGYTQPGITLVCGDSHSSTHGAFGALAFGIGASECECVLATQTLRLRKAANLRVTIDGTLRPGVHAKDLALALVGRLGAAGATGHAIEYTGEAVSRLSMAGRMTLCNMAIEAGSRTGLVAPDDVTYAWLEGRPMAPAGRLWEQALDLWRTLASDAGAHHDRTLEIDAGRIAPQVSWGTSPDQVAPITGTVPDPAALTDPAQRAKALRALAYMGLAPGTPLEDIAIDHVFLGSCTNGRIEDFRAAAAVLAGRRVAPGVRALAVPGSAQVKAQAEDEGLDRVFRAAGFEWRSAGCSLCVAMNDDRLPPGARCASTSNRNFEGRQGVGARTHLVSPAMAAAAAVRGRLADVRELLH